jgi:hypothetical protein
MDQALLIAKEITTGKERFISINAFKIQWVTVKYRSCPIIWMGILACQMKKDVLF